MYDVFMYVCMYEPQHQHTRANRSCASHACSNNKVPFSKVHRSNKVPFSKVHQQGRHKQQALVCAAASEGRLPGRAVCRTASKVAAGARGCAILRPLACRVTHTQTVQHKGERDFTHTVTHDVRRVRATRAATTRCLFPKSTAATRCLFPKSTNRADTSSKR